MGTVKWDSAVTLWLVLKKTRHFRSEKKKE